jgi:hypothetical protein
MGTFGDNGFGTEVAGAVTINHTAGNITTVSLNTAAGADHPIVLNNNQIGPKSVPLFSAGGGTNTTEPVTIHSVNAIAGSVSFKIRNAHASAAFNGTVVISFAIL